MRNAKVNLIWYLPKEDITKKISSEMKDYELIKSKVNCDNFQLIADETKLKSYVLSSISPNYKGDETINKLKKINFKKNIKFIFISNKKEILKDLCKKLESWSIKNNILKCYIFSPNEKPTHKVIQSSVFASRLALFNKEENSLINNEIFNEMEKLIEVINKEIDGCIIKGGSKFDLEKLKEKKIKINEEIKKKEKERQKKDEQNLDVYKNKLENEKKDFVEKRNSRIEIENLENIIKMEEEKKINEQKKLKEEEEKENIRKQRIKRMESQKEEEDRKRKDYLQKLNDLNKDKTGRDIKKEAGEIERMKKEIEERKIREEEERKRKEEEEERKIKEEEERKIREEEERKRKEEEEKKKKLEKSLKKEQDLLNEKMNKINKRQEILRNSSSLINANGTTTNNYYNQLSNDEKKIKETLEDMCTYSYIVKKTVIDTIDKEEYITVEKASEKSVNINTSNYDYQNYENESKYFILGLLGKCLENQGVETKIRSINYSSNTDDNSYNQETASTTLQFLVNGLNERHIKYEMSFEFGQEKNNKILYDNEEREKFKNLLTKKLSKEFKVSEEKIILCNFREGSLKVDTIIMTDRFGYAMTEQQLINKFRNETSEDLRELALVKKIQVQLIMGSCLLDERFLDNRGNRIRGWAVGEKRGGRIYNSPGPGVKGYGLRVLNKYGNNNWIAMDGNPDEWAVAYHGIGNKGNRIGNIAGAIAKSTVIPGARQSYINRNDLYHPGQRVGFGSY